MLRIKKNDTVMIMAGKDRGKKGKVLRILPTTSRAIVEGLNMVKKHVRRSREDQQGGIIQVEQPLALSKVMLFCSRCDRPTRVGFLKQTDGTKARYCKKCQEVIQ